MFSTDLVSLLVVTACAMRLPIYMVRTISVSSPRISSSHACTLSLFSFAIQNYDGWSPTRCSSVWSRRFNSAKLTTCNFAHCTYINKYTIACVSGTTSKKQTNSLLLLCHGDRILDDNKAESSRSPLKQLPGEEERWKPCRSGVGSENAIGTARIRINIIYFYVEMQKSNKQKMYLKN